MGSQSLLKSINCLRYCGTALAFALLLVTGPAQAMRVDSLYSAEVDLPGSASGLQQAFDAAFEQVLVKVTGLEALGNSSARRSLTTDTGQLVRQYSRLADSRIRVEFDGIQLERLLDSAGQPVWGAERPLIAMWYAIDSGAGNRQILAGGEEQRGRSSTQQDELRERLLSAAEARGLPMVVPLVDAEDLAVVSFSDVWGNFSEPVMRASQRYGADAALIGRARSFSAGERRVRWTLVTRTEQYSFESRATDGPALAAAWLGQRLATYADASGSLRLVVTSIDSLDRFGRLKKHLRSLNVVERAQVVRVQDDRIEFELVVRGDAARLSRALNADGLLEPIESVVSLQGGRMPDLVYNWSGGR